MYRLILAALLSVTLGGCAATSPTAYAGRNAEEYPCDGQTWVSGIPYDNGGIPVIMECRAEECEGPAAYHIKDGMIDTVCSGMPGARLLIGYTK